MAIQHNIYLLNELNRVQALFSNDLSHACPYFDDAFVETLDNGYESYEFSVPIGHISGSPELLDVEKQVIISDLDGILHLMTIRKITQVDDTLKVFSETSALDMIGEVVVRPTTTFADVYATDPLSWMLTDTSWSMGVVEVDGKHDLTPDYCNPIQFIDQICKIWGGEPRYRVELRGNSLAYKFVDILYQRGTDSGKTFEYRKDINSLTREVTSEDIATALLGIARDGENTGDAAPITFAGIEWLVSSGDPVDKPLGQDWVGIPSTDPSFGIYAKGGRHILKLYESEAKTPEELLQATWTVLNRRKKPVITYDLDVVLLERFTGYEHERVRIGDTVLVKDFSFKIPLILEARVQELSRSFSDKTQDKLVLGEYQPVISPLKEKVRMLEKIINDNRHKWYVAP